ncbi:MAG: adenylate/guanylate cyclase domain-containing response regulator [Anaerolineae bacterium]|nr:MAG: adenylate/guanylate cyclase domain-containing response regulator [Anaerolineae bacterium]WKZ43455.1 MAG: adenylate/guanylate cyclase domain-containing response regulator [Anaerolineales bacterium]WKZ46218.1 MAG: adenylate/guanylate cyclase domain-containing response regulator [Anaerolineales bacterium]
MKSSHEPGQMLVVDDNRVNRLLLTRALEQNGHVVFTAEHGKIAMEMLRSRPFDVILLDIDMPEMNGFEVLEALLDDDDLRDLPVIMTSASDELDRVVKCIEMGAEDYLVKPLNPVLLRARVNASLEKKRLRDQQRNLFRTFATPEVAEQLLREGFSLGGKDVIASVMFADIRSFTTLSENQEPAATIEMLNEYFALMFDPITGNHGTVNQMEGDGLMAIFGAPAFHENHREQAVSAALEMIGLLRIFNEQRAVQGRGRIEIGIGIATGKVIAGYTGTQHRATYTCVGDTVNVAARIEDHTKAAGKPILIDQATREGLTDSIRVEDLGEVLFKGKQHPIRVFSVPV